MAYSLNYELNTEGTGYILTGYNQIDSDTEIILPDFYNELPIVEIKDRAFNYASGLVAITIGRYVTTIGENAFNYTGLSGTLTIPEGVTTIKYGAFYSRAGFSCIQFNATYCTSCDNNWISSSSVQTNCSLHIGANVQYVPAITKPISSKISEIVFDDIENSQCKELAASAFNSTKITSLILPNSLLIIGDYALSWLTAITTLTLPENYIPTSSNILASFVSTATNFIYNTPDDIIGYIGSATNPYLIACKILDTSTDTLSFINGCKAIDHNVIKKNSWSLLNKTIIFSDTIEFIGSGNDLDTLGEYRTENNTYVPAIVNYTFENDCYYIPSETNPYFMMIGLAIKTDWEIPDPTEGTIVSIINSNCKILGCYCTYGVSSTYSRYDKVGFSVPDSVVQICSSALAGGGQYGFLLSETSSLKYYGNGGRSIYQWDISSLSGIITPFIPNSVLYILDSALDNTGIIDLVIPDNCLYVGTGEPFKLRSIHVGKSVYDYKLQTTMWGGGYYYSHEKRVETITCDPDNNYFRANGNCLIKKAINTLIVGCKNSVIPNDVTAIGAAAFNYCIGLQSLTVPDSITTINLHALNFCTGLTSVSIGKGLKTIGTGLFAGCENVTTVQVNALNPTFSATAGNNGLAKLEIGKKTLVAASIATTITTDITDIGSGAWVYLPGLTRLDIPSTINSLASPVSNCSNLTSIKLACKTVSAGFSNLHNLELCDGITTLNLTASGDFESLTIPETVTTFTSNITCTNLKKLILNCQPTRLPSTSYGITLKGNKDIEIDYNIDSANTEVLTSVSRIIKATNFTGKATINLGEHIKSIPTNFCASIANNISKISLSNSIQSIATNAFNNCATLQNISLPDTITNIAEGAFNNCENLTEIKFEGNKEKFRTIIADGWNNTDATVYTKEYKKIPVYKHETSQEF